MNQDDLSALIGHIYDAALDVDEWAEFLRVLTTRYVPGKGAFLLIDQATSLVPYVTTANFEEDRVASYRDYYGALDPGLPLLDHTRVGQVFRSDELVALPEFRKTEFYNDWARPQTVDVSTMSLIAQDERRIILMSVLHEDGKTPTEEELGLLRLLMPHLKRAAQVHRQFSTLSGRSASAETALDQVRSGVILLDEAGHSLFANAAARRLLALRDGLTLDNLGRPVAALLGERERLDKAIHATLAAGVAGGAVRITRPSLRPAFIALLAPLPVENPLFAPFRARLVLFVRDPAEPTSGDVLRSLYRLTPAETRLAIALAMGESLESYAEEASLSAHTVKTQLRTVFAKTGARRQGELVALVLRSEPG